MNSDTKIQRQYVDSLPSTRTIAMLAATMKASPEAALELWLESARMVEGLRDLTPDKRRAVLDSFGRDWRDGFEDNGAYRVTLEEAFDTGEVKYPVAEAMRALGISTEKTFWKLWEYLRTGKDSSDMGDIQRAISPEVSKAIEKARHTGLIGERVVKQLKYVQKQRRTEIGRQNKLRAGQKRKRRKSVK